MPKIIWTCCFATLAIFNTQPLWILIQGWEQGQESHYIQPSNLSRAFGITSLYMYCWRINKPNHLAAFNSYIKDV